MSAVILLVEDDENDVLLFKRALSRSASPVKLVVVRNGIEAMNYLCGAGRYRDRSRFPFPTVVLLDLNLPGVHGFDVLRSIRQEPALKELRVIVLTGSDRITDANEVYRLGANSFFVKPMEPETVREFLKLVNKLERPEAQKDAFDNNLT